jgi:hypothetical protein
MTFATGALGVSEGSEGGGDAVVAQADSRSNAQKKIMSFILLQIRSRPSCRAFLHRCR